MNRFSVTPVEDEEPAVQKLSQSWLELYCGMGRTRRSGIVGESLGGLGRRGRHVKVLMSVGRDEDYSLECLERELGAERS